MNLLPKSHTILQSMSAEVGGEISPSSPNFDDNKVKPTDFINFLPWACQQLEVDVYLEICRTEQAKYVNRSENLHVRSKTKNTKNISESAKGMMSDYSYDSDNYVDENRIVRITAAYSDDQLVQIKIDRTKHLPREVLAIIQLIIKFYPLLTQFSINSGADKYTIHEMSKILPLSNITEINFDNTFIEEANYDTVLDYSKQLKVLSLCRCHINDQALEKIASKLKYPSQASMTLSVLNLSSNQVTDRGATFLSKMLRTNRHLSYLNLACNMLTDNGVREIFNVMNKFCHTIQEQLIIRGMYVIYLKKRQIFIDDYMKKYRAAELEMRKKKRNITMSKKFSSTVMKKCSSENFRQRSCSGIAEAYEKALVMAKTVCGEFDDPLAKDSVTENGCLYSNGNNTLVYLNIAYNNISVRSVQLLLHVLKHQKALSRKPRGLIMVQLEGNPLPEDTPELLEIDTILKEGLAKEKMLNGSAVGRRKSINPGYKGIR